MSEETAHRDDKVTVTYNGDERHFEYRPDEQISSLLNQAKREFHVEGQHRLSLFTAAGVELPDGETFQQAGVRPGELLVLRQSTVKGGW